MKIKIIHLLVLACLPVFTYAQKNMDSLFVQGNRHYQQEEYEKAIEKYLRIYDAGYESPELYFNTANAYFRSNKLGKARLYYERALLLDPGDEDIQANLDYAKSMLTDRFEVVPELFLKKWYRSLVNSFGSNGWLLISLLFFSFFLVAASAYIFIPGIRVKRTGFFGGIIFFFFTLMSFVFSSRQYHKYEDPETAIVMDGSLVVKSAPRGSGKDLFILHEGAKVWLENTVDSWVEIRITDGRQGWVRISSIEEI